VYQNNQMSRESNNKQLNCIDSYEFNKRPCRLSTKGEDLQRSENNLQRITWDETIRLLFHYSSKQEGTY
jgi:hypothetical protein